MLLTYFLEKTAELNKEAFLKAYPQPALYFAPNIPDKRLEAVTKSVLEKHPALIDTLSDDDEITDDIEIITKKENIIQKNPTDIFGETSLQGIRQFRNKATIFFLTKDTIRSQLNDNSMVTVGRAAYNDIILADLMVSKNHILFVHMPSRDRWVIIDQNSTNGTVVDSIPLRPRLPHLLKDRAMLTIAKKFQAIFMQSQVVWEFICCERNMEEGIK